MKSLHAVQFKSNNISLVQELVQQHKFGWLIGAWLRSFDWTTGSPYDENIRSTPANDSTDVNSCRMEFFFYFLL